MDRKKLQNTLKIILGLLITGLALYFFMKSVDLPKLTAALRRVTAGSMAAAVALSLLTLYLRSLRLAQLLPDQPGAEKRGLFPIISIAFMINNIFPARLGEAARVYFLYKKNRFSLHVSLGSLFMERLADSLFYTLLIVLPAIPLWSVIRQGRFFGTVEAVSAVYFAGLVLAGLVAALLLYRFFPKPIMRFGDRLAEKPWRLGPAAGHVMTLVRESTAWLFQTRPLVMTLILSPLAVCGYGIIIYILASGMGIALSLPAAFFASGILAFGVAVPSSPGYVGTLHLALREALVLFGVDVDSASALAILYHLPTWAATTAAGLWFYFRMDVRMNDIRQGAAGQN